MKVNEKAFEQNATESDNSPIDCVDVKIASILIEKPASTDQEVAEKLGVSRQTVNRRKNSKIVQDLVRATLAIPEKEIRRLTAKALSRLEALLDHEDPKIKLAATMSLVKLTEKLMTNRMSLTWWD